MIEQIRVHNGLLYIAEDYSYELSSYKGEPFIDLDGEEVRFPSKYHEDGSYICQGELSKGQQWLKDNIKKDRLAKDVRSEIYGNEGIDPTAFLKDEVIKEYKSVRSNHG